MDIFHKIMVAMTTAVNMVTSVKGYSVYVKACTIREITTASPRNYICERSKKRAKEWPDNEGIPDGSNIFLPQSIEKQYFFKFISKHPLSP